MNSTKNFLKLAATILLCLLLLNTEQIVFAQTVLKGKIVNGENTRGDISIRTNPLNSQANPFPFQTGEDGTFRTAFNTTLPIVATLNFKGKKQLFLIEPEDSIFIEFDAKKSMSDMEVSGKGAENNHHLNSHREYFGSSKYLDANLVKSKDAVNYKQHCDSIKMAKLEYLKKSKFKLSESFRQLFYNLIVYDHASALLAYPFMYKKYKRLQGHVELPEGYYDFLDQVEYPNDRLLLMTEYTNYIDLLISSKVMEEKARPDPDYNNDEFYKDRYEYAKEYLSGNGLYFVQVKAISEGCNYGDIGMMMEKCDEFLAQNPPAEYSRMANNLKTAFGALSKGQPGPDFEMESIDGKTYTMKDFKGKVVYIDIWATWCGPCRKEMPHSKKLKEQFKGKDVEFVYISTDKNKGAWEKFVTEKEMGGVQLYAGKAHSQIAKDYIVKGIPRFILIDKNGNIVNARAKRPSQKGIAEDIEELLKKK